VSDERIEPAFRPAVQSDEAVVNSAFLRGLRESPYTNGLPSNTFFAVARQAWRGIRRDMTTTIAHVPTDSNEVMGFVVHSKDERGVPGVAWVYVAKAWRRFGVSRKLLEQAAVLPGVKFAVLFGSPQKLALYRSKGYQPAFAPFACWRWLDESTMSKASEPVPSVMDEREAA
jgi:GNAT superfamily N-acetyltransferase